MRMLVRFMLGLFVLKAVVASPRFSRQVDLDTYDTVSYDVDLDNLDLENQDLYDYEDGLTIDDPQIEIGTLAPPDYNYPVPEATLEEQIQEEEEEEEMPLTPQLAPQGSGGSGVLMGPDTQKEVELRLTPIDILHVSGDFEGSMGSGASGESGSGGSGTSGDIVLVSGDSEELLSSGESGEFLVSGDILISGDVVISGDVLISGDLSGSGDIVGIPSGDFGSGESGDESGAELSGDLLIPGVSGSSGEVSGDSDESRIILISGEEELPLIPETIPSEASGASGGFSGASGTSGASGDPETSGEPEFSGDSGVSVSGDVEVPEVTLVPDTDKEEGLLPPTPETPQEGTGTVEGSVSSGLPEPGEPDEPDEPVVDRTGMPTCLLCTCLGGSVYCDDLKLDSVPPLPKDTTHFYARYNRITKINKSDFAFMNKLKRIDLTANEITSIDDTAFLGLPQLEELVIRENHVSQLPALPETMTLIDGSHNNIGTKGIHNEAFKDMTSLLYLYLTDNHLDYIPVPLPDSLRSLHLQRNNIQMMHEDTFCNLKDFNYIRNALEDIRLDGNPINLSRTPQAYICLPRIPIGDLI
ncbi:epiphycan [Antennarius striatus]|uniref:epiphycan n=1 Tax=Antennarius striatus TaxID=241820 RepID=UPI0035B4D3AA